MRISQDRYGEEERRALTAMIVDPAVAGFVAERWKPPMFRSKYGDLVGGWCVEHFRRYGRNLGDSILRCYEQWLESRPHEQIISAVESLLVSLSGEYQQRTQESNSAFEIDFVSRHLNKARAARLFEAGQQDLELGDMESLRRRLSEFDWLTATADTWIDVLRDNDAIRAAFGRERDVVVRYPGAMGRLVGDALERDGFICFMGAEKRGKCIAEDMRVLLADGRTRTIRQIVEERDASPVVTYNEKSQRFESVVVSEFWDNGEKECWEVRTRTGRQVVTTHNHQYLTPDGWQFLENIKTGHFIAVPRRISFSVMGEATTGKKYLGSDILWDEVVSIRCVGKRKTYDLSIPQHHNFVANDCLVHNTWMLLDLAWRALIQRRKVLFLEIGDLSQNQIMFRFGIRGARMPRKPTTVRWPTKIEIRRDESIANVTCEDIVFRDAVSDTAVIAAFRRQIQSRIKSHNSYLRLIAVPNGTMTVKDIESRVHGFVREGWVPDLVIIDYADLILPPPGNFDVREGTNRIWKGLRGISQQYHCLVVTATQANAASYTTGTMTRRNFSEDKRKLAHATGIIGLAQTPDEKDRGILRANWVVLREDDYSESRYVHMATCLPLANPLVRNCAVEVE